MGREKAANFSAFLRSSRACDDCSALVAGFGQRPRPQLFHPHVRRRAFVRSPASSWRALLGCDVYVVRTFAREPTWLAHVILRNLLTAKNLWLRIFVAVQKCSN